MVSSERPVVRSRTATFARVIDVQSIVLAALIAIAQITVATSSGRGDSWQQRYTSLASWDAGWYADILTHGYRTDSPPGAFPQTNAAFFPGYPSLAWIVAPVFSLSPLHALLVTSQLAAFVLWYVLLRLFRRWGPAPSVVSAAIAILFCQPGAFYLVVAYSESTFLGALVILLSCAPRASQSALMLIAAAAAGYVMSATRIVGAPMAALAAVWAWPTLRESLRGGFRIGHLVQRLWPYAVVSLATAFGAISFLWYCAVRFGDWDAYRRARALGWGVFETNYGAILWPENFRIFVPRFHQGYISSEDICQLYLLIWIVSFTVVPVLDFWLSRKKYVTGMTARVVFYAAGWLLLLSSTSGSGIPYGSYNGFLRYGLYNAILLILALVHGYSSSKKAQHELPLAARIGLFLFCGVGLALQLQFCWRFARGVLVS